MVEVNTDPNDPLNTWLSDLEKEFADAQNIISQVDDGL